MAIKKSDLYASLWASCDELRGGMDASQYTHKGVRLGLLHYRRNSVSTGAGRVKHFA